MPPILIRNALHPEYSLLLVDGDTVHASAPALLEVIGSFADDGQGGWIAAARARSGYGYIDGRGNWLVAPTLQDARAFSTDGLARFQADGLWGYLDLRGATVIAPRFAEAGAFCRGLAPVRIDGAWRYIERSGAFAFDAAFSRAGNFSEVGLAFAKARNAARFGFIDTTGNWAIAPQFAQFRHTPGFSRHGVAPVTLNDREFGLIDTAGNWIVAPRYSGIEAFDGAGYACCHVSTPGAHEQIAWLDTSGREVIPLQEDLASQMADGLVRRGFSRFVGLDGELATSRPLEWADHFNGHGFTVACTGTSALSWGVLRADGHFQQAPEGVLEPLTAPGGEIVPTEPGTPLVPFLTRNQDIALLDRHGGIAYRLEREPAGGMDTIVLRDADGRTLWRGEPVEGTARPRRFLAPVPGQFLEGLTDPALVAELAASLLAQTRGKLAQLASGELRRADEDEEEAWNGQDEDDYASNRDGYDEDDPGGPAAAVRTSQRVFRTFLDESTWGSYPYLSEVHISLMKRTHEEMAAKLVSAFGSRAIAPDYAVRGSGRSTSAWAFGDEPERLWVGIKPLFETMGGACWCHIWLHCAPSLASLKEALAAAPGSWAREDGEEAFDEEALGMAVPYADAPLRNHHAWVEDVGGYDGWLREVSAMPEHLAHVPPALLDDAMVDAALHADPEAYHHVPTPFHTPARLEALIRKGLAYALRLPLSCMTAQGLALARTLYGDTPPWQRADRQRSVPPQRPLDSASLMNVWGCCIDADMAIDAVRAGVSLKDVPRWLRSAALIDAALENDIDNLRWLDRDQVTPAMAARAARVCHGDLMAFLPRSLLTPELCLAAVRANGCALEFVPPESITASLGAAAVEEAHHALEYVPPALRPVVMRALADSGTYWYD